MVKKLHEDFIYKETLIDDLNKLDSDYDVKTLKDWSKNSLCWEAFDAGLINENELKESLEKRTSTIPCYLHTHVKNEEIRKLIEAYVIDYSKLFTRGSYIANLAAQSVIPNLEDFPKSFPRQAFCLIPEFLKKEENLKKCFYPERWDSNNRDPLINNIINTYSDLLKCYLPRTYEGKPLFCNTGWDNALNHMGTSYLGHIEAQILTHLPNKIVKWFEKLYGFNKATNKSSFSCFLKYLPNKPTTNIHNDDFETLMTLRNVLGLKHKEQIKEAFKDLNDYTWSLHIWLQNKLNEKDLEESTNCCNCSKDCKCSSKEELEEGKNYSILPVVKLNRKYAYMDYKIVESLLKSKTLKTEVKKKMKEDMQKLVGNDEGSKLQKLLGLTRRLFNENRKFVRDKLRKREHTTRYKKKKNSNKKHKNKKNKWKYCGRSSLPKDAEIISMSTDGIGLRLCLQFTPNRPLEKPEEKLFPEDCVKKAADTGRAKLATTCDEQGNIEMMKRKAYYYAQRHYRFEQWETSRRVGNYQVALAAMSEAGGFKSCKTDIWVATLEAQKRWYDVIEQEQLVDKERAMKKMVRFRYKKSWLDRRCRELLAPAKTNHMILGIGDGQFACVGKGELAVPTEGLKKALHKAIKMLKLQEKVKIVILPEDNTTKCCHCCGKEMNKIITRHGKECYRYRLCPQCGPETKGKRRERDVNASKNLLCLLKNRVLGLPRPAYLRNPWKPEINVALPPLVRTAPTLNWPL